MLRSFETTAFALSLLGASIFLPLMGCSEELTDRTPGGALLLFLAAMEGSQWDADARRDAYQLLASPTQARLRERSDMTNMLGSREFEPWEMLAQGRFRLLLDVPPERDLHVVTDGDEAVITVRGGGGEEAAAQIPMSREDGGWRVNLEIPPLRPTSPDNPPEHPRLEATNPG